MSRPICSPSPGASLRFALMLATAGLGGTAATVVGVAQSAGPAPLTNATEVRSLSEAEARRAIPVRLRGVYIGEADPVGIAFVIHDQKEGLYVQGPADIVAGLRRGDLLEIEGVTDPGGFAPYVVAAQIHQVGRAPLPEPLPVRLDDLIAGQLDASWVEFTGVVRSIEPKTPTDVAPPPPGTRYAAPETSATPADAGKVKMKLASTSAEVVIEVTGDIDPNRFIDAEVRVRGLCFNLHNRNRQFVRPFVQVPVGEELVIERAPPEQPFSTEPRPVSSLLQFEQLAAKHGHRVHVRGVVIYHRLGTALWIRDGEHSVRVETSQAEPLAPGDEVDVLGFPARGEYSAVLEDAIYRRRAGGPAPRPHVLHDVASAVQNDADLVELQARLTELRRFSDSLVLALDWQGVPVRVQMQLPERATAPADWLPGSIVRVAAVCAVIADGAGPLGGLWEPQSFQLLLRSPADLAIVQRPPWWNAERVVWVLSAFLAGALAIVAVVMLASRRRLKDQEHRRAMAEAEFTAILSERNRVAREIHDTLSQSLGAISVQLELARVHANEISPPARSHLGSALRLTRAALAEARESIWNMRSQVLEKCDLADALAGILAQLTDGTGVQQQMRVHGARRRLPPVVENNLLRIGQEAITNACKHADPRCIQVELTFDRRTIRLVVIDDGRGFVADASPPADRRSFGLVGIKERAELLGGTVTIQSAPGQGTQVSVSVTV